MDRYIVFSMSVDTTDGNKVIWTANVVDNDLGHVLNNRAGSVVAMKYIYNINKKAGYVPIDIVGLYNATRGYVLWCDDDASKFIKNFISDMIMGNKE